MNVGMPNREELSEVTKSEPATLFNKEHAASYDERFARLAPLKDSLHLLIRILFSELPERARILCVGAGTGAELIALAQAFPGFEFTAVEPSKPMLEVCRKRAAEMGVALRCTFHHGYLHTLAASEPFDAATSVLVSQFLVQRVDRVAFFDAIAQRLRPGGLLVSADLSADLDAEESRGLKDFWRNMLLYSGVAEEQAGRFLEGWKGDVAVLPPAEVEGIIAEGAFAKPTLFYQSLFIHGWYARRAG
jgi:tRNA (cmo5U34)-methyltransferase